MGLMFEHLRPMSLVQAYCTGNQQCTRPSGIALAEILSGHQPHDAILQNFDKIDWTTVLEEANELVPKKTADMTEVKEEPARCETNSKVCPWCMKKTIMKSSMKAIMKVKAMCEETTGTVMEKMCPWMKENREVSLGMILAKVEPWKFAKGWCMHKQHR